MDELLARLLHQKRVLLKDTRTLDLEICAEFLESLLKDKKKEKVSAGSRVFVCRAAECVCMCVCAYVCVCVCVCVLIRGSFDNASFADHD